MIFWLQNLDFKSLSSVMLLDTRVINLNRTLTCTRVHILPNHINITYNNTY